MTMNARFLTVAVAAAASALPACAHAAPGMGDEVYGATLKKGEIEAEAIYGQLGGGPDDSEDAVKLELAYTPTERLRVAVLTEFEREPGMTRKGEEIGVEAIYTLGRVGGIDVAVYGEYAAGLNGHADALEGKLLLEKQAGKFDARLNLIFEKPLEKGEHIELGYAASADVAVAGDFRVGAKAFGDLGTFDHFAPHAEHFVGPIVRGEIEGLGPEIEIEAGYLFALAKARDDTKGQFRLGIEVEF